MPQGITFGNIEKGAKNAWQVINDLWGTGQPGEQTVYGEAVGQNDKPPADKASSKKKAAPKKKVAATPTTEQPSPWTQLSEALVGMLQQEQAPVEAALSGALVGPSAQSAENIAEEATGISPSSPTGQWMQSQMALGKKENDPLMAALASYGSAYGAGQEAVDKAMSTMGELNQTMVNTAPEQAALQTLTQTYGKQDPSYYSFTQAQASALPPAVQEALYNAGYGGITPPKGGWGPNALPVKSPNVASALSGLPATPSGATTPGTTPASPGVGITQ
jgi:hypothetical protein